MGAVRLAMRLRLPAGPGVVLASLPILLGWSATTRRAAPARQLPRRFAESLLNSVPKDAVLFVEGDNDTYPLWFVQRVDSLRRDVTVVTVPLLGARWYTEELARRHGLAATDERLSASPASIATRARALGRPVAAAVSLSSRTRNQLSQRWKVSGMAYVEGADSLGADNLRSSVMSDSQSFTVDSATTRAVADSIERWLGGRKVRPSTDSVNEYVIGLLACPRLALADPSAPAQRDSLASVCNRR